MPDPKEPAAEEADKMLDDIETPHPATDPADEIEDRGAPAGGDFA